MTLGTPRDAQDTAGHFLEALAQAFLMGASFVLPGHRACAPASVNTAPHTEPAAPRLTSRCVLAIQLAHFARPRHAAAFSKHAFAARASSLRR